MINLNSDKYTPFAREALRNILTVINDASHQQPDTGAYYLASSHIPKNRREAKAMLLTPAQADALAEMQGLCNQILKLNRQINVLAVAFGFVLNPLVLPEIIQRLSDIDTFVFNSKWVARRMGVAAIVSDARFAKVNH